MTQLRRWQFMVALFAVLSLVTGCGRREEPTGYGETVSDDVAVAEGEQTVSMKGDMFTPASIVAPPGAVIVFMNDCTTPHTVTPDTAEPAGGPNSDVRYPQGMQPGEAYRWQVPEAGLGTTWYYHCRFHGRPGDGTTVGTGMAGAVTIGQAAVTADGDAAPETTQPPTAPAQRTGGATGY